MQLGKILGADTISDTRLLVEIILSQAWKEQFTIREMRIMAIACAVTLIAIVVELVHLAVFRYRKVKTSIWSFVAVFVLNIVLFVGLVVGQLYISNFFMAVRAPRAVQHTRAVPQLFSLTYQTYDPQYSVIVWGYDPNHLDFTELGGAGNRKTRRHDFNLSVEPKQTVYFQILVGDELYGVNSKINGKPYQTKVIENEK